MRFLSVICLALAPFAALAQQGTEVLFGGLRADPEAEVQVTSDSLSVDQAAGQAVFVGSVVVTQGSMRLEAAQVEVIYSEIDQSVTQMHATGGVRLTTEGDAAQASEAIYRPGESGLVMTGDVLMTQGSATMAGQRLNLNLETGLGTMEGRVTTTFAPKAKGG